MKFLWPVVIAFLLGLLFKFATEQPIGQQSDSIPVLGQGGYDLKPLDCPTASGILLRFLAWVIAYSPVGPIVRRVLLNNNGVVILRELGHQAYVMGAPLLFHPMRRLSAEAMQQHQQAAASQPLEEVLQNGLGPPPLPKGDKFWSVDDYAKAYRSGHLKPSEVMSRLLNGTKALQQFHMWTEIIEAEVMHQAEASDARFARHKPLSWLDGVPIGVKDMLDIKGHTIRGGTHCVDCPKAAADSTMVAAFRTAGAIIVGTTLMTELGVTPLGWNAHYGGTFNPYNMSYYPGGSSSGSAVAVATGLVPIALGADGGGSIRIPASMSGTFGLATTYGRIPLDDLASGTTMMHTGPLAATARDAAYAYAIMAPQAVDSYFSQMHGSPGVPPAHLQGFSDTMDLSEIVLGVFWDHFLDADAEVVQQCKAALDFLVSCGAKIVNITIPNLRWLSFAHGIGISCEFSAAIDAAFHARFPFEPNTQVQLAMGSSMSAKEFLSANRIRGWAWDYCNQLFATHRLTAIVSPTVGTTPALDSHAKWMGESNTPLVMQTMKFVFLANFLGYPGISVPISYYRTSRLPIGLHLMADHWQDHVLLRLASAIETGLLERRKPLHFHDMRLFSHQL